MVANGGIEPTALDPTNAEFVRTLNPDTAGLRAPNRHPLYPLQSAELVVSNSGDILSELAWPTTIKLTSRRFPFGWTGSADALVYVFCAGTVCVGCRGDWQTPSLATPGGGNCGKLRQTAVCAAGFEGEAVRPRKLTN